MARANAAFQAQLLIPVIVGPTGIGKSQLAFDLALALAGEIVVADSKQVYQRLDIATNKPSPEQTRAVRYHMIDFIDPATSFNGNPTIDTTQRFYRGDSQGGISGGVYMAISTDVTRGLLGETGAPYNTLLCRSADFNGFFLIIQGTYPNPLDIQLAFTAVSAPS